MQSAEVDVAVIGAGAAGVAAAHRAMEAGLTARVLEARNRAGGRAWTDAGLFGFPVDRGCQWMHSADINPLVPLARELGFSVPERNPRWQSWLARSPLSPAEARQCREAFEWFFRQVKAGATEPDRPVSALFPEAWEWEGAVRAVLDYITASGADHVSTRDLAAFEDTGNDWPVVEGYGAVIERLALGVPVSLGQPVTAIEWDGAGVRVHAAGGTLPAHAAVITVPTPLYERIRFRPALPVRKQEAAASLRLGAATRVELRIEGDPFGVEPGTFVVAEPRSARRASIQLHPFSRPLASAFYGADLARELEHAGAGAAIAHATDELVAVFGSRCRRHIAGGMVTGWSREPWSLGAYSAALPGHDHARTDLGETVADRLFFAGEACAVAAQGTAHGAWQTGLAAGAAAAATLLG